MPLKERDAVICYNRDSVIRTDWSRQSAAYPVAAAAPEGIAVGALMVVIVWFAMGRDLPGSWRNISSRPSSSHQTGSSPGYRRQTFQLWRLSRCCRHKLFRVQWWV